VPIGEALCAGTVGAAIIGPGLTSIPLAAIWSWPRCTADRWGRTAGARTGSAVQDIPHMRSEKTARRRSNPICEIPYRRDEKRSARFPSRAFSSSIDLSRITLALLNSLASAPAARSPPRERPRPAAESGTPVTASGVAAAGWAITNATSAADETATNVHAGMILRGHLPRALALGHEAPRDGVGWTVQGPRGSLRAKHGGGTNARGDRGHAPG
jgi:hypothetical protein